MPTSQPIKVIIADDHSFFRNGFKNIIQTQYPDEINFVAEVPDGAALLDAVDEYRPDVVITDIQMPSLDGVEACRKIKKYYPRIPVIAFSMFSDSNKILQMIHAGANGYLVKTSEKEEVMEAIHTVKQQRPYYCSSISDIVYGCLQNSNQRRITIKDESFSVQEKKVMQLICRQLCTKEIAATMNLATRTVENYRKNILEKIGAKNVVGIALYAVAHEIVSQADLL